MKNLYFFLIAFLIPFQAISQEDSTYIRPSYFGIAFTMENAFGFYPVAFGGVGLSSNLDLTFYGAFWTNPSFGFPQTTFSSDLWLENGFGLGFNAMNGDAYINPSIGFTHGKFLSGGDEGVAFEGIVPSLAMYFTPGKFDSEVYISLYQHLRDEVTDPVNRSTADFIFYWVTPGYWINNNFSIGVHYEGLFLKFGEGDFLNSYQWLGPYIKIRINDKYDFRFAAGPNLEDKNNFYSQEFYKLSTSIPLN